MDDAFVIHMGSGLEMRTGRQLESSITRNDAAVGGVHELGQFVLIGWNNTQ
jgi:hypothetical protein